VLRHEQNVVKCQAFFYFFDIHGVR
jgi:hypothetical protein